MDFSRIKGIETLSESLRRIAAQHYNIDHREITFEFEDINMEVSDAAYDAGVEAARKAMLSVLEAEYADVVKNIEKLGVTRVPAITEWPEPKKEVAL